MKPVQTEILVRILWKYFRRLAACVSADCCCSEARAASCMDLHSSTNYPIRLARVLELASHTAVRNWESLMRIVLRPIPGLSDRKLPFRCNCLFGECSLAEDGLLHVFACTGGYRASVCWHSLQPDGPVFAFDTVSIVGALFVSYLIGESVSRYLPVAFPPAASRSVHQQLHQPAAGPSLARAEPPPPAVNPATAPIASRAIAPAIL